MGPYENAWQATLARLAAAAQRGGRDPADGATARGVQDGRAVPRSKPCTPLGQRAFGENYVQEAAAKRAALADLTDI